MTKFNFDEIIDRSGSLDYKHCAMKRVFGRDDLLPLWVADMDFATPDFVIDALRKRLNNPILGYTTMPENYWQTVAGWIKKRHGWQVECNWMKFVPGIVKGIGLVVNFFTKPGDKIIIQPPVYHPFRLVPQGNGRKIVNNPLIINEDGRYSMDFEGLENIIDADCRLLILCNPHNPGGICWDKNTLQRLAEICYQHNIIVISDEIHCDMALFGHKHIPFASVSDKAAAISISFGAPSKTFNIAGVVSSYAIIPDDNLRKDFFAWLEANEFDSATMFAVIATIEAFSNGEEWRKQMLQYIESNVLFVEDFCKKNIPKIIPLRPEASYLVWLNCRGLHLNHEQLNNLFVDKAHLALNDGEMFGQGGEGFMRLNVGTPQSVLKKAMIQLEEAVKNL